ncbi:TATA-box-binding protein [Halalkalicoccus subterraneus]|uniref:TATA-box-binding protein n=1 Tax=Halalkalicoccus subterraneus TaxID=2675002 RepID=UPI000EFA945C|nr:TATA-box-binding protein [Halalkalicoccus subterraneus]
MAKIVNAVGGGDLHQELDLNILHSVIDGEIARYDPEHWPGLYLRLTPNSPAVLVFSSGKYNIAGATSIEHLLGSNGEFLSRLEEIEIVVADPYFEVRNLVLLDDLGKELDLGQIAIALGLESTEYEPEQFPGLLYRPNELEGTFLIFRTGNILLTGLATRSEAEKAFDELFEDLTTLLP